MRDIENREDLLRLMTAFYDKLFADEVMRPIFTDVAKTDLPSHFPILVDFWDHILFDSGAYKRNAMQVHLDLGKKTELKAEHFDRWLKYFEQTFRSMHEGPMVEKAVQRAKSIAFVMQVKLKEQGSSTG